jgi:RNA polymerase sigma-70 factor (ECF subfamily)
MIDERDSMTAPLEQQRAHLRSVAYRMLGSLTEADDALQEAWLRFRDQDAGSVDNPQPG